MRRKTNPEAIAPYLKDASNCPPGAASEVVIPETVEELKAFLKENTQPVTVSGAGTGLTASRVPVEGIIVSMERFKKIGDVDEGTIFVEPAVTLEDLNVHLKGSGWFYPPNPTETLASIGGTLATNASGSRSYKFGVTRDYVQELDILLADGRSAHLRRGQTIDRPLELDDGTQLELPAVEYRSPQIKNAAGYFYRPGMDWIDLFVGSDGTLCLITGVRLKLRKAPFEFLSGILFMDSEEKCWNLVEAIRKESSEVIDPCSLEYFDRPSLIRLKKKFQNVPDKAEAALFFEQDVTNEEEFESSLEAWYEFLESQDVLLEDSWFAQGPKDIARFHDFRHQVPLILNEENSRMGRVKMGTDMAVDDDHFLEMMRFYRVELEESEIDYAMFGHIGDNHLHINLLPDKYQIDQARALYGRIVDQILEWGGTVSAEHGVGKLKKAYYHQMVGKETLDQLRTLKNRLDIRNLLGRGNLL
ncbi:putative Oxidoreductase, FAD-binding [Nitrospina gracilis 3/211]|uniref:D-lactate dehydrogenase (cytochrome) n=1 Tax=Nitrospina gracilis (strain 3/211) TaxID=1266370 RepID=M1Z1I7_NITG3|nr:MULTISPECIES: FAD-binding oxidoreductase [Nitrospina]MCF8724434.1 D-lactate dehydrogenase (cytochrome) [Nitrospina sp. Nb-3]CCQ91592.1 putative Oxidoreductase, FAD-binding [Nitrospina gracilis 3/211]